MELDRILEHRTKSRWCFPSHFVSHANGTEDDKNGAKHDKRAISTPRNPETILLRMTVALNGAHADL
jgi:hypothetical protein